MGAIKGGSRTVATIVQNRKDGEVQVSFDLTKRIDLRAIKKHWKINGRWF
jgi:hypothetical protein